MKNVPDFFGCSVFDDRVMKAKLPSKVYLSLRRTIEEGEKLDISVANAVADAMKDWAAAKGATHYTHWFQPLTGVTAEKHDGFISPVAGRRGDHGIFGEGADQGGTGRVLVPIRRTPGDL